MSEIATCNVQEEVHPLARILVARALVVAQEDSIPVPIAVREQIVLLEERMKSAPEKYKITIPPSKFHFLAGMVGKETFMPKGTLLTGKLYKKEHLFTVMRGKVTHITEFGVETLVAPYVGHYPAGIKRVAIIEEDCLAVAYFATEATTEEEFDEDVSALSYTDIGEYDPLCNELLNSLGGTSW